MDMVEREKIKKSFSKVKEDISILREALELILLELKEIKETLQSLSLRPVLDQSKESLSLDFQKIESIESKSKPAGRIIEKAEKNILRNMKKMIKNEIFGMIETRKLIAISHLQTIICVEKQLCSRASFFNYMKELKEEGIIINKTLDGQRTTQTKKASETKEIQGSLNF